MIITKRKAINYEVLTQEGDIVGGVYVVKQGRYKTELINLFINKEFQGQGYGRLLMQHIFNEHSDSVICLQCEAFGEGLSQDSLKDWYERLGFIDGSTDNPWMHRPIEKAKTKAA